MLNIQNTYIYSIVIQRKLLESLQLLKKSFYLFKNKKAHAYHNNYILEHFS